MNFMITKVEWYLSLTHIFCRICQCFAAKSSVLSHSMTFKMPGTKVHSADNWPIFQDNGNGEVEMHIVCEAAQAIFTVE